MSPATIVGAKGQLRVVTDWDSVSDRLHVMKGGRVDSTWGWVRLYTADEAAT